MHSGGVQESGVRSQESGARSQESGVRSQESGVRSQESGVRSQESEVRSQKSEVRSPKMEVLTKQRQIAELAAMPEGARRSGKVHSIYAAKSWPEEPYALIGLVQDCGEPAI